MKINDIKPKHIVLGQEYDDFSRATDKVDFSKEDLCCQVVGLTSVYYWLNTETVWGPLGFIWDEYNSYGHFGVSTINFNIIPKIPDSIRHTRLAKIFKNLDKELVFLDSDWSHITNFENLSNTTNPKTIDWHCDSISNLENILANHSDNSYIDSYILRAALPNTNVSYATRIHLVPENKNKLKLDVVSLYNRSVGNIYVDDIEEENTFDLREYIRFGNIANTYSYYIFGDLTKFNNLIFETTNIFNNSVYIEVNSTNDNEDKVYEKVTYELNAHKFTEDNKKISNGNQFKSKSFEYININNGKYTSIDSYFIYGIFEYGTPQITQDIINFITYCVFSSCEFFLPYQYGKIKCTKRIFGDGCIDHDIKKELVYNTSIKYYSDTEAEIVFQGNSYELYSSNLFNYEYTKEDYATQGYDKMISIPKNPNATSLLSTFHFYDLKIDYVPIDRNKSVPNSNYIIYTTSVGEIEYFSGTINQLVIHPNDKLVTFHEEALVCLGWTPINNSVDNCCLICKYDRSKPIQDKFRFTINQDNITSRKTMFDTRYLRKICKNENINNVPYVVRNSAYAFVYNDENNKQAEHKNTVYKQLLPEIGDTVLIYNVDIDFTRVKNPIDNEVVQYILDNIITVGNSEDSNKKTISILSEYYNSLKESTKERLLADGYTIIEIHKN